MLKKLIKNDLEAIGEGIRDLPANLLLLLLATLKAIVNETQSQLLALFAISIGTIWGIKAALAAFVGLYGALYFIVDLLRSRRPPTHN